ncbi:MAG: hypothetical protein ACTSWI_04740 [Alphaproteobacteria bacterium]
MASLLFVALVGSLTFVVSFAVELPFIRNQVDATIEQALGPGYEATVGSAILAVDPVLGLVVRLSEITVVDTLDQEVARIPSAMIALNLPAIDRPMAVRRPGPPSIRARRSRFFCQPR